MLSYMLIIQLGNVPCKIWKKKKDCGNISNLSSYIDSKVIYQYNSEYPCQQLEYANFAVQL